MSSVSGSDSSSRQDDVVRRNREEYKQRESELIKKQQKEIRRLNEAHYAEVDDLKQAHAGQMGNQKQKSQEAMSRRDMKFQKEIESLRTLHRKQLSDLQSDSQMRINNSNKTSADEISLAKRQFDERTADMSEAHRREMAIKNQNFTTAIEELSADQKSTIENNRNQMNTRHEKEMKALVENRTDEKADMQRQFKTYRQNAEGRLKEQELQHMSDRRRSSDNFMSIMRNERLDGENARENLKAGYKDSLSQIQEKYHNERLEDQKHHAEAREGAGAAVKERIDKQVRSLENTIRDLESQNVRDRVTKEQSSKIELKNAKDAYQANVDVYKQQKEQLVQQMNQSNAEDVSRIHKEAAKNMNENSRYYQGRMHMENAKNKEAVLSMNSDFAARQAQTTQTADSRVKNILDMTEQEKVRLSKNYQHNFEALRDQQVEKVRDMHVSGAKERAEAVERLKDQMRQRELQHQEKVNSMRNKYEKQLAETNDKRMLEKRASEEALKRQSEDLKRAHKMELEAQQTQYQGKVDKMQQQHSDDMKSVSNRHQEQIDNLVGTLRKS